MVQEETISLIRAERSRQDQLHGEHSHSPTEWLPILIEEAGEVSKEVCDGCHKYRGVYDFAQLRQELVQVAAVAVAWIEDMSRAECEVPDYEDSTV